MNGGPLDEFGLTLKQRKSVVYLLYGWGTLNFKIGVSINLKARVYEISQQSAVPVICLASIPGDRELEASFHNRYTGFHSHGEWYTLPDRKVWEILCEFGIVSETRKADAVARGVRWFDVLTDINTLALAKIPEVERSAARWRNRKGYRSRLCKTGAFLIIKPDTERTMVVS